MFSPLENQHNLKKEMGKCGGMWESPASAGEGCSAEADRGTTVCEGKCLLQASGSAVLLGHACYFWFVMGPCEWNLSVCL